MDSLRDVAAALQIEQADALALWRSLTQPEWQRASQCQGWSVKDVVIHTVKGEAFFLENLRRSIAGQEPQPPDFALEQENERQIAIGRRQSTAELVAEGEECVAATHKFLGQMSEADWIKPAWNPVSPGTAGFYVKGRIWEWWTHNQDLRIPLKRLGGTEEARTTPVVEVIRDGISSVFLPERARGVHVSYAFQVGPTGFTVRIDDGQIRVDDTFDPKATSRVKADPATFALVSTKRIPQFRAVLRRKFKPSGNPIAGLKFLSYFRDA